MGISHSTARYLAPLSFLIDFGAQQYGMLASPNMKDVHDANLSFWSPQPYFIAAFFFPQQIVQCVWLWRLWKSEAVDGKGRGIREKGRETKLMLDFVPFYVVGNLCIASWMIFWNSSALKTANVFVLINSLSQLAFISFLQPPMDTSSTSSILTHVVSKTFAGIGVLDLLHNGSVAYFNHQGPSTAVKVVTGVGFAAAASCSDWIFGGCLVYDLVALSVGQTGIGNTEWGKLLGIFAVGTAGIVGLKNWVRPPYVRQEGADYAAEEDS